MCSECASCASHFPGLPKQRSSFPPGVRSQLLQCFRGVGCGGRPGEAGMPVRSQEPGPEVGRGLRPAAGREVGGAGAKVPAAAANPGSLQPSCPTLPGRPRHTPPQLRFPVHLRGGHSSRRPPLRPARNKGGGGDSCHRRRPPPRRGPDSPHLPLPRQPREGAAPAPRPARTHRGRADGVPAGGATRTAARPFTAPSAPPLQPPQRGLWRPSEEDTWWEGRGGRGRGC